MGGPSTSEPGGSTRAWIDRLLANHADETRAREIAIRCDLDPAFQIALDPALEVAFVELFRFVFSTIPNHCEIFVGSARSTAAVAALGSGSVTVRWQAAGMDRHKGPGDVVPMHPIIGKAEFHLDSDAAGALGVTFDLAGWDLDLLAMSDGHEMRAHASTRSPSSASPRR